MAIIDADAHVIETDRTWEYMDDVDRKYIPPIVVAPDNPDRSFWIIDGEVHAKGFANIGRNTTKASRELLDVKERLRHMDELGTDIQVLYPSMLAHITSKLEAETALFKSYNRWLADVWRQGENRLRWVARLPLLDMDAALDELRYCVEHGACGVFLRSFEGQRLVVDPYFFPLYEEASRLNVPICIHASIANPMIEAFLSQDKDNGNFTKFKLSVVSAFHSLIVNGIPDMFPQLRFGIVEISSQWVPFACRDLARRFERQGWDLAGNLLRDNRVYVTCQIDDDIPYVLQYAGEDNLIMGTDYGHADNASELAALTRLKAHAELPQRVIEKILDDNARALYGI